MKLKWRPIVQWPGQRTKSPKRSQFSASYTNTLPLNDDELRHLRARNVVPKAAARLSNVETQTRPPITPQQNLAGVEFNEHARRKARAACHPDRHAGDQTRWNQLNAFESRSCPHGMAD